MLKVVLFVVITSAGHPPQPMDMEVATIAECLTEVRAILENPTFTKLSEGTSLQAGCALLPQPGEPL